jgi:hypothetical protein
MDEEKKPESGGEQLGPYLLHEQLEQDEPGRGELYQATHETTGATALVLKPAGDGPLPLGQWQVRCVSSASPGYLALEVERTSWSRTPDRHWVEGLVFTLEDVHEAVRRMARALPTHEEPRSWWRPKVTVAGAAAVCALVVLALGGGLWLGGSGERTRSGEAVTGLTGAGEAPILASGHPLGAPAIAYPLPEKPFRNQAKVPCIAERGEVEINGGCWVELAKRPPCHKDHAEYQGKCYLPISKDRGPREPQAVQP